MREVAVLLCRHLGNKKPEYDLVVVGGGIVGRAVAQALALSHFLPFYLLHPLPASAARGMVELPLFQ